ncbi:MAG: sulfotransferase [Hydrocarboniphaga sp.]|uniref:sulfotransferase family protein n=1 Tax=Hydrocarboniphaga sp. TaxID=2033016 RepID=UPI0026214441|nr:sulfotransferase [Hydrocarboniphaga sp.]MDB5970635.1 sulfotransferase [Hydrocarboniphaga sp.]
MIQASQLLDQARARSGLRDFGDESFLLPLQRLVESINGESRLSEVGSHAVPEILVASLINRLEIESWYARHPEIEDEQIVAPLFGIGLPRTGSTALGYMLSLDPDTRVLREWESGRPCPQPRAAASDRDPRIAAAQAAADAFEALVPQLRNMLPRGVEGPQECYTLLQLSFSTSALEAFMHVPSYVQWVISDGFDMRPAYRYHRRVLKLLQWQSGPRRWFVRTPAHMFALDALDSVYADAQFVMTHRDPVKALPSLCSLMHQIRCAFVDNPQPVSFGRAQAQQWALALERTLAFRRRVGEARFFDVSHRRQTVDPVEQIHKLYQRLGWRLDGAFDARVRAWQDVNPQGLHKVDPGFFGLDAAGLAQRYAFYTDGGIAQRVDGR